MYVSRDYFLIEVIQASESRISDRDYNNYKRMVVLETVHLTPPYPSYCQLNTSAVSHT